MSEHQLGRHECIGGVAEVRGNDERLDRMRALPAVYRDTVGAKGDQHTASRCRLRGDKTDARGVSPEQLGGGKCPFFGGDEQFGRNKTAQSLAIDDDAGAAADRLAQRVPCVAQCM